jgi:hypothetical protein
MTATDTPVADPLNFSVSDVTGMHELEWENCDGHRMAGEVAHSIAAEFGLDTATPYSLRDVENLRMLLDDRPIGSQVDSGVKLVAIPKPHLGGA